MKTPNNAACGTGVMPAASADAGRFELAIRSDARLTRTASAEGGAPDGNGRRRRATGGILCFRNPAGEASDDPGSGGGMLTNPTEIGTARLPLRRSTRPPPTDASPNARACVLALAALEPPAFAQTSVPSDWSLTPTGLTDGTQFRLLFLSSTTPPRRATGPPPVSRPTIQNLAAAGHADIQADSAGFRVAGCTADAGARDPTSTTGTGVGIYRRLPSGCRHRPWRDRTLRPAKPRHPADSGASVPASSGNLRGRAASGAETLAMYESTNVSQRKMRLFRTWIR